MAKNTDQELLAQVEALTAENAQLKSDLSASQSTLEEVSVANANFAAQVAALMEEKEAADKTVGALLEQVSAAANGAVPQVSSVKVATIAKAPKLPEPFEVDGTTYQFLKPAFNLNAQDYTAEQAAAQPELLAALLAIEGQNIVQVIG